MCLLPGFSSGVMVVAPLCSGPPQRKVIPAQVTSASSSHLFGDHRSLSLPQGNCTGGCSLQRSSSYSRQRSYRPKA
ncbi:hypothetical protein BDZ89DRAFT_490510 [Hymenopellis radicata]|nr:hypothetical protein BDZ89DRAFT_490510 [Hymenopellis radicata]